MCSIFFLISPPPPRSTRTYTLIPYTPHVLADWAKNAYIDKVVRDAAQWVEAQKVAGLKLEVLRLPGRTPVIYFEVPATRNDNGDTVLMYGHLRSEEHTSELQSLMRTSNAVFCLKKNINH